MKKPLFLIVAFAAMFMFIVAAGQGHGQNQGNANSLGKTTLDAEVGWIASGADDGEFITAERQGIVIGLRAMEQRVGLLEVSRANGNRVGVYNVETGTHEGIARWNYDWHVDVSGGVGPYEGRELEDFSQVLEQDYTEESLFGALGHDPVVLTGFDPDTGDFVAACGDAIQTETLCQQSWNPMFGNTDFDPAAEGTYSLRLVLTPETFDGPPLAVAIQVNVTE